jgi:dCTP deaminase
MIKSDRWIRRMAQEHDMINPYSEKQVSEGVISYGVSSYGYDLRVADEFKIFTNVNSTIVDPKHFDERSFVTVNAYVAIVPPNSFALARSVEYFKIPRDVLTICVGKSTYARCGIIVNVTPFEPEWEGFVTLEISNTTPLPAKIYANEGLCQILFFQSDEVCETSYKVARASTRRRRGSCCRSCEGGIQHSAVSIQPETKYDRTFAPPLFVTRRTILLTGRTVCQLRVGD